jgi:hypothetical protein
MQWTRHHRHYESEFGEFIDDLKRKHPDIEKKQLEAHAMWWDKPPLDLDEMERERKSSVEWKPYD